MSASRRSRSGAASTMRMQLNEFSSAALFAVQLFHPAMQIRMLSPVMQLALLLRVEIDFRGRFFGRRQCEHIYTSPIGISPSCWRPPQRGLDAARPKSRTRQGGEKAKPILCWVPSRGSKKSAALTRVFRDRANWRPTGRPAGVGKHAGARQLRKWPRPKRPSRFEGRNGAAQGKDAEVFSSHIQEFCTR